MALVKLTSCWNALEAEILRGALESAGIPCIVQSSTVSTVRIGDMGIGNSAFEVPILVREEDLADALEVIRKDEAAE